jgi:hypothetical protein
MARCRRAGPHDTLGPSDPRPLFAGIAQALNGRFTADFANVFDRSESTRVRRASMDRTFTVRDRAAAPLGPLCHTLLTFMAAPAAGLNVGSMALTVSPPADSQRRLTLQTCR